MAPANRSKLACLGALAALAFPGAATADVFEPTRFDDPDPGRCKPDDCSLREATLAADRDVNDADKIKLKAGRYRLSIPEQTNGGEDGGLNLYGPSTVIGKGSRDTIVDARGRGTAFRLIGFGPHKLRDLKIKRGVGTEGGGIYIEYPFVTLKGLVITGNAAASGGGIYSRSGGLEIIRSTISQNTASSYGGGLFSPGALVEPVASLKSSTVSGNTGSVGGGIALDGFDPGGFNDEPSLDALNSTIADNRATVSGGGISSIQNASVELDNSTVTYNAADTDNSGGGSGGGLWQSTGATLGLVDSILAENTVGTSGGGPQCGGTITATHLAVQPQGGSVCTLNVATYYQYGDDRHLGPLAQNGGPTKTVALLDGNGAIGLAAGCPGRDQRRQPRPATGCDAGAFESPLDTP